MILSARIQSRHAVRNMAFVFTGAAIACAAHAGTDVTVYGVADLYGAIQKGDRTESKVDSGGLSGSRLGVGASHDLGGSLKAIAKIEAGVSADTGTSGQGGRTWGRQAYGGLSGDFGTLTLGRQYTPTFNALDNEDPFETGAGSAISSGIVSTIGGTRADDSIAYELPRLGAFTANVMYAAGESTTGANTNNSFFGGSARFTLGALGVSVTYGHVNRPTNEGVATNSLLLSGAYDFGSFSLSGGVQGVRNLTGQPDTSDDRTEAFAGIHVPVGPGTIWFGAGTGATKSVHGSRATQVSAAYLHALDKSTTPYAVVTSIHNGSIAAYTDDTATGAGPSVSPGVTASAVQIGGRYRF